MTTTGLRSLRRAVIRPGLPKEISSHDLRHFYASRLIHAGESVVVVADRLGHANATTVLKTYAHMLQGQEDRTRKAMDEAWTSGTAEQRPTSSDNG